MTKHYFLLMLFVLLGTGVAKAIGTGDGSTPCNAIDVVAGDNTITGLTTTGYKWFRYQAGEQSNYQFELWDQVSGNNVVDGTVIGMWDQGGGCDAVAENSEFIITSVPGKWDDSQVLTTKEELWPDDNFYIGVKAPYADLTLTITKAGGEVTPGADCATAIDIANNPMSGNVESAKTVWFSYIVDGETPGMLSLGEALGKKGVTITAYQSCPTMGVEGMSPDESGKIFIAEAGEYKIKVENFGLESFWFSPQFMAATEGDACILPKTIAKDTKTTIGGDKPTVWYKYIPSVSAQTIVVNYEGTPGSADAIENHFFVYSSCGEFMGLSPMSEISGTSATFKIIEDVEAYYIKWFTLPSGNNFKFTMTDGTLSQGETCDDADVVDMFLPTSGTFTVAKNAGNHWYSFANLPAGLLTLKIKPGENPLYESLGDIYAAKECFTSDADVKMFENPGNADGKYVRTLKLTSEGALKMKINLKSTYDIDLVVEWSIVSQLGDACSMPIEMTSDRMVRANEIGTVWYKYIAKAAGEYYVESRAGFSPESILELKATCETIDVTKYSNTYEDNVAGGLLALTQNQTILLSSTMGDPYVDGTVPTVKVTPIVAIQKNVTTERLNETGLTWYKFTATEAGDYYIKNVAKLAADRLYFASSIAIKAPYASVAYDERFTYDSETGIYKTTFTAGQVIYFGVGTMEVMESGKPSITVMDAAGVGMENVNASSVIITPNPSDGNFEVNCASLTDAPSATLQVMGMDGTLVYNETFAVSAQTHHVTIKAAAGCYIVKLTCGSQAIKGKLMIK